MSHKLFTLASSLLLNTLIGCGGPAPAAGKPPAPPQTQDVSDVSVTWKDLGPTGVTLLAQSELFRVHGGGLDVICLADGSSFLMASPDVRLPLLSAGQVQYQRQVWDLMLNVSDAVNPPSPSDREMLARVRQSVVESQMLSGPFSTVPDRLARALASGGPGREQYAAVARRLLGGTPAHFVGQRRTTRGLEGWQVDLQLTAHGRAKLRAALSAPPASHPTTMSTAQGSPECGEETPRSANAMSRQAARVPESRPE